MFCQGFSFICELCGDERDVIFPFQLQKVAIYCSTCFHKACYVKGKFHKCFRIEARRRQIQETKTLDSAK
ncbi:run domain Beclin-1-interacting and cysteine-rich domain-containing protein-like isoform X1 [Crassostrea virginica]